MSNELVQTGFFDLEEVRNSEPIQVTYDYSRVTPEQADKLETIYNRMFMRHLRTAYEDGKDLLEAKQVKDLPYNEFIEWAQACYGWSERVIDRKINRALYWGDFTVASDGKIDEKAIEALSTKRVPESARKEAKALLTAGISITEDQAKEIRDRHKAEVEELKEANQELQKSLDLFKEDRERERMEFESNIRALNNKIGTLEDNVLMNEQAKSIIDQQMKINAQEIAHLLEELAKQPEKVEVEKFVTPPEVEVNIKSMKERISALEEENNKLLDSSSAKATEIEGLTRERDSLAGEKEGLIKLANNNLFAETQTKYEAEIKDKNRQLSSTFDKGLRDARALLPNPIDAKQAYGGDEWARIAWMKNQALRFIDELDRLKESIESRFIDATPEFEVPIAYIEAGRP